MAKILNLVTFCLFIHCGLAGDAVLWSNKQDFKLEPMETLIKTADPENPLIFFFIDGNFHLADFSRLAAAYSDLSKSEIPSITSAIQSSKGYAGEWISDDLISSIEELTPDKVVKYYDAADTPRLAKASVVLVRAGSLLEIDKKVKNVLENLREKSYRAILTGLPDQSKRSKREAFGEVQAAANNVTNNVTNATWLHGNGCLLYLHDITIRHKEPSGTKALWLDVVIDTTKAANKTGTAVCSNYSSSCKVSPCGTASFAMWFSGNFTGTLGKTTIVVDSISLKLDIELSQTGYWKFVNISIQSMVYTRNGQPITILPMTWSSTLDTLSPADIGLQMYSVPKFAWACYQTETVYLQENRTTPFNNLNQAQWGVQFGHIQVQPFNVGDDAKFTDNVDDCVGFFSIGIWMGILIGVMMLLIFLYGISMVTNLKTMDRFDDPKGKMIQINAKD